MQVCLCFIIVTQYCMVKDVDFSKEPLFSECAKETNRLSTTGSKFQCRERIVRLRAVLQHGCSEMIETRKKQIIKIERNMNSATKILLLFQMKPELIHGNWLSNSLSKYRASHG